METGPACTLAELPFCYGRPSVAFRHVVTEGELACCRSLISIVLIPLGVYTDFPFSLSLFCLFFSPGNGTTITNDNNLSTPGDASLHLDREMENDTKTVKKHRMKEKKWSTMRRIPALDFNTLSVPRKKPIR